MGKIHANFAFPILILHNQSHCQLNPLQENHWLDSHQKIMKNQAPSTSIPTPPRIRTVGKSENLGGHNLLPPGWDRVNWSDKFCGGGVTPHPRITTPPRIQAITSSVALQMLCPPSKQFFCLIFFQGRQFCKVQFQSECCFGVFIVHSFTIFDSLVKRRW